MTNKQNTIVQTQYNAIKFRFFQRPFFNLLYKIIRFSDITLESRIDVGQGINVGPGKFVKKNKRRALNKRRA